ncbi:F-box/kelch-repeat protein At3g23880-like [Vicia villosa]|uniref:F-box/kelch-repeat protein At3g23880-like n=1 Tax=Vicia villosa TaxID=3911 RepID=UPI00273CA582|nr:F-box/kelch-repeat protein At3g23880-like [Vicia villosa]
MNISPATIASSPVTLPEELIAEVLSLLKVKSLLRFKCVNKSWNSLISDPFFVKMHLIKSSRNPHILHSLTYLSSTSNSKIGLQNLSILRSLLENPSINLFPKDSIYLMEKCCHIIGSCNGLTCLVTSPRYPKCEIELYIWNPATRCLSQKLDSWYHDLNFLFKLSFGYDNLTDKYKVVAFRSKQVRVFTIGDNVWRNVQIFPTYPYEDPYTCCQLNGVYLNNSLNWFSLRGFRPNDCYRSRNLSVQQFVIISFDLGIETNTQILFPHDFDQVPDVPPIVCVLMECLCFSHFSKGCNFVIWQMKEFGVQESWTKLLKFEYCNQRGVFEVHDMLPLHVFENGDTLIFASNPKKLILYNSRENRVVKQTTVTNRIHISWFNINNYVESLLSLN